MRSVYRLNDIENNLRIMRCRPLDILVVGAPELENHLL